MAPFRALSHSAPSASPLASSNQPHPASEAPAPDSGPFSNHLLEVFTDIASSLKGIDGSLKRIADVLDPAPPDLVGTPYVASKLGVTTTWIADQIRSGQIPSSCLVPGAGNGKPWKFYRDRIDRWIASR